MKLFSYWWLLLPIALVLTGCFSPEQVQATRDSLQPLVESGHMTQATLDQIVATMQATTAYGWTQLKNDLIQTGITLAAGFLGIRQWRGSTTARKGNAPGEG